MRQEGRSGYDIARLFGVTQPAVVAFLKDHARPCPSARGAGDDGCEENNLPHPHPPCSGDKNWSCLSADPQSTLVAMKTSIAVLALVLSSLSLALQIKKSNPTSPFDKFMRPATISEFDFRELRV